MSASRRVYTLEGATVALIVVLFYHPLLRFGWVQSGGDAANLFLPMRMSAAESLWGQGVVPLWNHWSFLGAPLHASLQHAVFYPVDWVIYGLLPTHVGINAGNLFHLALTGVGMWGWLRFGFRLPAMPAVTCGAAFPCSAWFWGHQEHINQLAAASYIPVQALMTLLFCRGSIGGRTFILLYALIGSMALLAGHPQEAFYGHLLCGAVMAGKLLQAPAKRLYLARTLPAVAAAFVLVGLITAVQLLPTIEASAISRRSIPDPGYALSVSMPPQALVGLIAPHYFGSYRTGYTANPFETMERGLPHLAFSEYGLFPGIPALLFALIALVHPSVGRFRKWLLVSLFLVSLLMALGGNTDPRRIAEGTFTEFPAPGYSLYDLAILLLPPLEGFRVPPRILVLAAFALFTLAALGFAAAIAFLVRRGTTPPVVLTASLTAGAAILLSLYIPSRREKFHDPVDFSPVLTALRMEEHPAALNERVFRLTTLDDDLLVIERTRATREPAGNTVFLRHSVMMPHLNVPRRTGLVQGYEEGLVPTARFHDFLLAFNRNLRQERPDPVLLSLLGVRHVLTHLPVDHQYFTRIAEPFPGWHLYENPLWRGSAFAEGDVADVHLERLDGPMAFGNAPMAGRAQEEVFLGTLPPRRIDAPLYLVDVQTANTMIVSGPPPASGDVLLAMGWYPGWSVLHQGEESSVEFINAVHARLPASRYDRDAAGWQIAFRPFSYRLGLFLSALGLAIAGYLAGNLIVLHRRIDTALD